MTREPGASFRFRLTVLTAGFFLVFKLVHVKGVPLALGTWAFEACVWGWILAACLLLDRVKPLAKVQLPRLAFAVLWVSFFTMSFFSTWFFADSAVRKYSLLDVLGVDSIRYFLGEVVPQQALREYAIWAVGLNVAALLSWVVRVPLRPRPVLAGLCAATLSSWVGPALLPAFPTPLWDLGVDLAQMMRKPSLGHAAGAVPRHPPALLDRSAEERATLKTPFKRVLVFVMESITLKTFLDSRAALSPDSFFNRVAPSSHFYSHVLTSNMDSRTGLLALLTSRLIPCEAYRDIDIARYSPLGHGRSLVDLMKDNGYHAVLATSQVLSEPTVREFHWDERLVLDELDKQQLSGHALCFNPYRFEDSCEDGVMLPRLYARLDAHEKLFWVQQLVWGHTRDYSNATKKTDVQYYGEMLDQLVEHLKSQGQLDETLIVVTSDHGTRDKDAEALASSYRIPLLFYAPSLQAKVSTGLYSQIHFKDLLVATLNGEEVAPSDFAMFIGPTHSSIVGVLTKDDDFMVVKNRALGKYALAFANVANDAQPAPPKGSVTAEEFLTLLDDYRRHFDASAGR